MCKTSAAVKLNRTISREWGNRGREISVEKTGREIRSLDAVYGSIGFGYSGTRRLLGISPRSNGVFGCVTSSRFGGEGLSIRVSALNSVAPIALTRSSSKNKTSPTVHAKGLGLVAWESTS